MMAFETQNLFYFRCAIWAPGCFHWDAGETIRAVFFSRRRWAIEPIHLFDDHEHDEGDDDEVDNRVDEGSIGNDDCGCCVGFFMECDD